ncbi:hypothetical protein F4859DRAFT_474699 [Xylaria cf. heliscus]|nr:hypothetical protein F4859DRAFT_474699 [Xylaria cf. heliscus]
MGGKIECYLDIPSYYSYIAFVQLQQNKELLKQHGVEVELHPFLLGAINVGSGNRPPSTLPAKAKYLTYDSKRAADAVGLKNVSVPGDLIEVAKTMLPLRALTHIKSSFPGDVYTTAFAYLFHAFWTLHKVPNTAPALAEVLSEMPVHFQLDCFNPSSSSPTTAAPNQPQSSASERLLLFTPEQVARILEATSTAEMKNALKARVDEALARGAFGAPWIWATNAEGRSEPFFGSDRWNCVYDFLGIPYRKIQLLPPQKAQL